MPDFKGIEVELPDEASSALIVDAIETMVASVDKAVSASVQMALATLFGGN